MAQRSLAVGLVLALAGVSAAQAQAPPIEMDTLRQLDAWTVGAISRAQGGLPDSLWAPSDAALLGALFDRLPATFASPAARALARRALASAGDAPQGLAAAEAARKRFSALARLGFAGDVAVMAAGAPLSDPDIAQFAAQAELAQGRTREACQRVRGASGDPPAAFVLRLRAYCAAAAGETAAADLALEVARSARAEDAWFRAAIAAIQARPARPPPARYDTSLNAALSLAANLPPGANPLGSSTALALLTIVRAQQAPPGLRAQAAALAFRRGALPAAEAREAFRAAAAANPTTATGVVAAVRDAEAAPGSLAAATAIATILRQSSAYEDFAAAARLFHDDIAQLSAAPDAASALLFARAAAASGDFTLADRLADSAAQADADAAGLARVRAAVASGLNLHPDAATRAFLIAHAPQGGHTPDPGLLLALQTAASAHAIGETAIIASLIAAPGAHTLDADTLGALFTALAEVDLDDAVNAFGIEALLGAAGPAP
jgi:hypothetical protein